ncbi:hypothetical protein C8R43DRAFT_870106, partial [Mycena crocata]
FEFLNILRCFPHVINIAVQTALKVLSDLPDFADFYWAVLQSDVVALARTLVTACRASGQRRDDFEEVILQGNIAGGWPVTPGEPPEPIRVVGLLKDVDTRWSSIFSMLDRVLELYPAIDEFLKLEKNRDIAYHALSELELAVLRDIREFLQVFHLVQELVSAEKTPTLCIVLPLYERLIIMLRDLKRKIPKLSHAITASIRKLEEYLALSRRAPIYALAMGKFSLNFAFTYFDSILFHQFFIRQSNSAGCESTGLQKIIIKLALQFAEQ